jgi:hypothetical protein
MGGKTSSVPMELVLVNSRLGGDALLVGDGFFRGESEVLVGACLGDGEVLVGGFDFGGDFVLGGEA